jgi:hypothetical protein
MSLPMGPDLPADEQDRVVESVAEACYAGGRTAIRRSA